MADLLIYATIPLFITYFYLFQRTFRLLDPTERKRFTSEAGLPAWRRILGILPVALLLFTSDFAVRLALVAWWLLQVVVDTRSHHQKLQALRFDPAFRSQLQRTTYLSVVALLVFATGMLLKAR